ncbi:MAG: hypothetical protein LBS21_09435 [Clostridiales bacterium]|nr:hypothetical protein [Clostridiales bacterium]
MTETHYPPLTNAPEQEAFQTPITCLDRLHMELGHKPYCGEDRNNRQYKIFLEENGLYADWKYNRDSMEKQLLKTVISIMEMLANNLDNYMKIETNFLTQSAALDSIHKRIAHLESRIDKIKREEESNSDFTYMFYTRKRG